MTNGLHDLRARLISLRKKTKVVQAINFWLVPGMGFVAYLNIPDQMTWAAVHATTCVGSFACYHATGRQVKKLDRHITEITEQMESPNA